MWMASLVFFEGLTGKQTAADQAKDEHVFVAFLSFARFMTCFSANCFHPSGSHPIETMDPTEPTTKVYGMSLRQVRRRLHHILNGHPVTGRKQPRYSNMNEHRCFFFCFCLQFMFMSCYII